MVVEHPSAKGHPETAGPWLGGVRHRRGRFILDCPEWKTVPGLTAVVGLNGAGKSTLLGLLSGLHLPSEGRACGVDGMILLPQSAQLAIPQRVEEVYVYLAALRGVPRGARRAEASRIMALCGLDGHRRSRLSELSGGWRQRVLIGQCLLGAPRGLVLDEPTASLDVAAARACWRLMAGIAADAPVIVATHEASAALEFCDQLVTIHGGRVGRPLPGAHLRRRLKRQSGSVESFLLSLIDTPHGQP